MKRTSTKTAAGKTAGKRSAAPQPLDDHLGFQLRVAYQRASANLAKRLQGSGLSVPRYAVLLRLYERGALSQNELGRQVVMEPANIHDMVRSLKGQKLVRTKPDPDDSRRRLVELTAHGRTVMKQFRQLGDEANRETLTMLTRQEARALLDLLRKLTAS